VIDDLEDLIDWVAIGPRFSVTILTALRSLLTKRPPKTNRRIIIATSAQRNVLSQLNLLERVFFSQIAVPNVSSLNELIPVLTNGDGLHERDAKQVAQLVASEVDDRISIGIKNVLRAVKVSKGSEMPAEKCSEILRDFMVRSVD